MDTHAPLLSRGLLLAALLFSSSAVHAAFTAPCAGVAKAPSGALIDGCTECMKVSGVTRCQLCHHTRVPKWSSAGIITQCAKAAEGAAAVRDSGDPLCLRSDGPWCATCRAGNYFDPNFRCVNSTNAATTCRGISKNSECAACNPDGTCKKCAGTSGRSYLVPLAAIYINVPAADSKCYTLANLKREAESITGIVPWSLPANCREVTSDFRCARCIDGYSVTADGKDCKPYANTLGSKCKATVNNKAVPYVEYCTKCNTVVESGKAIGTVCKACSWGRTLRDGQCKINCKQLFGIGCKTCSGGAYVPPVGTSAWNNQYGSAGTPGSCTSIDQRYAQGRRPSAFCALPSEQMKPLILLLAAALALAVGARAGPLKVACEDLTDVDYCIECTKSGATTKCLACHRDRAPVYSSAGAITQCKATTANNQAVAASGDTNCKRADGQWCIECKDDFWFDASFKCVTSAKAPGAAKTLEICQKVSKNAKCAACNPDGTCSACRGSDILAPLNAEFINAGWRESKCYTLAGLNEQAKAITWNNANVPTNCIEVDSDFKCTRCKDGMSLTGGTCKTFATGSKCGTLGYKAYCARCNAPSAPNKCVECNGSRGLVGDACTIPCKRVYGIGCRKCNATACTKKDPAYANGRR
ncbi:extracellular matrix FRAS1 [Micractinium conductrix]|uniref:Extracellular matrix FRAS1 n=1 Tax=Micractinium conductrix TaxID=554055 RepID=A0A2P6V0C1_9CHLO|nr:extracellular matrix FRAS1 [Micractinium conductrix]|eukprot:PSC67540.1 extracellular matrix FRAS1 [Micractinium conductrix]